MSGEFPPINDALSPAELRRLEEVCDRFEADWKAGQRPKIEDYLGTAAGLERAHFLGELLSLELAYRLRNGESVVLAEYVARFPEQAKVVEAVFLREASPMRGMPVPGHGEVTPPGALMAGTGMAPNVRSDRPGDVLPPRDPTPVPELPSSLALLSQGTEVGSSANGGAASPRPAEAERPARLGRYRITAELGAGSFGVVYKAHDDELGRDVAIKVPHRRRVSSPRDIGAYLAEARTLAGLNHPGIVPVYDAGRTEDGLCYVVSQFIEGNNLRARMKLTRPTLAESVEIVARVAEALHYAHQRGLVHRDVKPANILLDVKGRPYLADFGLAMREEEFGQGPEWVGTLLYMSPEQARFEGHRVDARSDIYSLGVVFYELLTGQRPFAGLKRELIRDLIKTQDPRPPRQLDDTIPKELDRICIKSLSKRAADRYSTAIDLAEDLRHWQATNEQTTKGLDADSDRLQPVRPASAEPGPLSTGQAPSDTDRKPVRIVPKGLRSFDAGDADFFLELLPGPKDRDGLPDSIRFWKRRIEAGDAADTFSVGLLYGPSGCGKSSLVKAGLLPRLAGHVLSIYVEATAAETESRLLKSLLKVCPHMPGNLGLVEILTCLRQGRGAPGERKVLLVLDQFEQWLHAQGGQPETDLIRALRQCDGEHLQCLVMVRDDFWMATTSFMRELEIPLLDGENSTAVELFQPRHARKVLTAYGRAFGALPEEDLSPEQEDFLRQAVEELTQDGKVIPVRLSLFAEMVKGRFWRPATLKEVGGTQGIGVRFLEDTFSASTAPPEHRFHQKAARAVLTALLPEEGTAFKGHMRSSEELLVASGYARRPREFENLMRILDTDLRLVTPTDPEGIQLGESLDTGRNSLPHFPGREGGRCQGFYQLTHDYLVPALQQWLRRKRQKTLRGRAELRLAERASLWNALPKNRYLPSWWELAAICLFTRRSDATPSQRKMLRKAAWYYGLRGFVLALVLAILSWGGWESYGPFKARTLRDRLLEANTSDVPGILEEMAPYRRWLNPLLRAARAEAESTSNARKQLHTSLALLPIDSSQLDYLSQRLLDAEPHEFPVLRDALANHDLVEPLWAVAEQPAKKEGQRLRAACALAAYDPDDSRWDIIAAPIAVDLVRVPAVSLETWVEFLRPVRSKFLTPLAALFRDSGRRETERSMATDILTDYAADRPDVLADLLMDADEKQFAVLYPKVKHHRDVSLTPLIVEVDRHPPPDATDDLKERLAKRQANAAVALLRMDRAEKVWPLLKHSLDPRVRSYLIHRFGPLGADVEAIIKRLPEESDVTIRRALILSLGPEEFGEEAWTPEGKKLLVKQLQETYRSAADPGLHAAAEWLLRQWKEEAWLRQTDEAWAKDKEQREKRLESIKQELSKKASRETSAPPAQPQWIVNSQGQTMVVIPGRVEFLMGSPSAEAGRFSQEQLHRQRIGGSFAIATKAVTVEQFLKFRKSYEYLPQYARTVDCPVHGTTWYLAAEYCNWLSEQEGLPKYYQPNQDGKYEDGMKLAPAYLEPTGYRLLTEAEWEYACRAAAVTSRYYGESDELLEKYGWYQSNSGDRSRPVASLKPNDWGLFDMHGNVWTWCQERYKTYDVGQGGKTREDNVDTLTVTDRESRVMRGGSFVSRPVYARCANRYGAVPTTHDDNVGFRVARTIR